MFHIKVMEFIKTATYQVQTNYGSSCVIASIVTRVDEIFAMIITYTPSSLYDVDYARVEAVVDEQYLSWRNLAYWNSDCVDLEEGAGPLKLGTCHAVYQQLGELRQRHDGDH